MALRRLLFSFPSQTAAKLDRFLDSAPVVAVLFLFTIFALFGEVAALPLFLWSPDPTEGPDVRVLLPPSVDLGFDVATVIAMGVFTVEMSIAIIVRPSYRCSILLL